MMKKLSIILAVLGAAVLMFSCTDRGTGITDNNIDYSNVNESNITQNGTGHEFAFQLGHSMYSAVHRIPNLDYAVYAPPGYRTSDILSRAKLPVLYLLAPFKGDNLYYFKHGLSYIADELIESGEIEKMFIVCVNGSVGYGGHWYGDTYSGGKYAEAIADIKNNGYAQLGSLIEWIGVITPDLDGRRMRGISGFEMGGYGAVRIGIEYSENFGSISSVSAPLDFDGSSGNGGLLPLFHTVASAFPNDSAFRHMDSLYVDPLRNMIMSMGCSFTPHLDFADIGWTVISNNIVAYSTDTMIFDDTLTLFRPEGNQNTIAFHLPFDASGNIPATPTELSWPDSSAIVLDSSANPWDTSGWNYFTSYDTIGYYDSLWTVWLNNSPSVMLSSYPGALNSDSTAVKLIALDNDAYGFDQQTISFANQIGVPVETFSGYNGYEATTAGRYVYDILPELLKFHSNEFKKYMD